MFSEVTGITEPIEVLTDNIAEVGAFAAMLAVFMAIVIFLIFQQQKLIKIFIDSIIGKPRKEPAPLVVPHTAENEQVIVKYEQNINEILRDLLYTVDAGRTFYVRYHNGNYDLNGNALLKMTMTNEEVRPGLLSTMGGFKDQLRTAFYYPLQSVDKEGIFLVENIEDLQVQNLSLHKFLESRGVTRSLILSVRSKSGFPMGFVGVEYLKPNVEYDIEMLKRKTEEARIRIETLTPFLDKEVTDATIS